VESPLFFDVTRDDLALGLLDLRPVPFPSFVFPEFFFR